VYTPTLQWLSPLTVFALHAGMSTRRRPPPFSHLRLLLNLPLQAEEIDTSIGATTKGSMQVKQTTKKRKFNEFRHLGGQHET
jgi:hypothetical protein